MFSRVLNECVVKRFYEIFRDFNAFIDKTKGGDNKRLAWVGACAADAVLSRDLVVTTVPGLKEQSTHSKVWRGCLQSVL